MIMNLFIVVILPWLLSSCIVKEKPSSSQLCSCLLCYPKTAQSPMCKYLIAFVWNDCHASSIWIWRLLSVPEHAIKDTKRNSKRLTLACFISWIISELILPRQFQAWPRTKSLLLRSLCKDFYLSFVQTVLEYWRFLGKWQLNSLENCTKSGG